MRLGPLFAFVRDRRRRNPNSQWAPLSPRGLSGPLAFRTDDQHGCTLDALWTVPAISIGHASGSAPPSCPTVRLERRQLPGKAIWQLRVLCGLSRRTLNESHEPRLAVDDDFASHPVVFEPVVAVIVQARVWLFQRARGQASRRTSTSCGFHANRTTGMFSILSERYGCGNQKFRARFLGPCPADAVGVVEQGVLIFTKLVSPDQIAALNLLIGLAIDRLYPDPNCRSRD